jgi:hypothetical protein
MPALFAYLIAVGIFLWGGYGALSWLAAPEPVKVVTKAKPKPPPLYEASSEAMSFETSSLASDHAVSGSNDPPPSARSEASGVASEQGAQAQTSGPLQAQQSRAAAAGVSPPKVEQEVRQPALAVSPANNAQPATSTASATTAGPVKRPHPRQASNRSEKSALALMTLRTIEFPDGRRVTQLIPYRNGARALAFQPDE